MRRTLALAAGALVLALALAGCNAVEGLTKNQDAFWHSDCHPDIWTTQKPDAATDGCNWTLVESR